MHRPQTITLACLIIPRAIFLFVILCFLNLAPISRAATTRGEAAAKGTGSPQPSTLSTAFAGPDGVYAIEIGYFDENPGNSLSEIYVNDRSVGSWDWGAQSDAFHTVTFSDIVINNNDIIKVISYPMGGELAQIDYLTVYGDGEQRAPVTYRIFPTVQASKGTDQAARMVSAQTLNLTDDPNSVPLTLDAPVLSASGSTGINVSWTSKSTPITHYSVRYRVYGQTWTFASTSIPGTVTTYLISGLTPSTQYEVSVRPSNNVGNGSWSAASVLTLGAGLQIPAVPTGLTATAGSGQVALAWSASSGATSYHVKRATASGGPYTTVASPTTNSYTNTGLTNGTTYYYVVSAVNSAGESGDSSQASAMLQAGSSLPSPIVAVGLNENAGTSVANSGSAGGTLVRTSPTPAWSTNVPSGVGGASSVDFGTTTGNFVVESGAAISQLAGLAKFTVTGWVNCRNNTEGSGGNRLVSWIQNGAGGVDVVYRTDGSIQVGIDQWPDSSPARSSAGKIPANSAASASNWRFFAVTYDSTLGSNQVKFYFGDNTTDATLDVAKTYSGRGSVDATVGRLALGHFNSATRASALNRMFRGLIDNVKIYGAALSAAQVVEAQREGATSQVPPTPTGLTATAGSGQVALAWTASSGATSYHVKRATVSGGPYSTVASPTTNGYTNTGLTNGTTYYYVVSAVNSAGESGNSSQVSATAGAVLWQDHFDSASLGQLTKTTGDALFAPTAATTASDTYENGSIVDDGEGGKALRHNIPANSQGHFIVSPLLSQTTDHATFEYDLRFDANFDWRWGGKVPGLVGVRPGVGIYTPTSGNPDRDQGFSTRMMWHGNDDNGTRPFASKLPPIPTGQNDMVTYIYARYPKDGFDGFGWHTSLGPLSKGVWHHIKYEVKMNTPSQRDGVFRIWFDGVLKYQATDWDYRAFSDVHIQAILWDIHRGGNTDPGWISNQACQIDVRNVVARDATP